MNMELSHNVIRENVVYNEYECESKSFLAHPDPCCHAFRSEEKGVYWVSCLHIDVFVLFAVLYIYMFYFCHSLL